MAKQEVKKAEEPKAPMVAPPTPPPTGLSDNITSSDLRLPRIALLQSKSPQVENNGETYKAGLFIDTLTQDILTSPVTLIPCFVFKNVIKWKPRSEGGGMVWKTINPTAEQLKELQWDGANKPTADQYINAVCLLEGQDVPLIVSFCKTSLKTGQDFATLIQLSKCAWKFKYLLTSEKVAGKQGSYYIMRIKRSSGTTPEEATNAAALYEQVKGMAIDTDYEGSTHEDPASTTGAEPQEF